MKLLVFLLVILAGIILCKLIAVGIILLFMYIKGKSFNFEENQWDEWLLNIDEKKLFWMFTVVYLFSAAVSSFIAYGVLNHFNFRYAFWIALIFFVLRLCISWIRYNHYGKEYLSNQIEKIHKISLKNQ